MEVVDSVPTPAAPVEPAPVVAAPSPTPPAAVEEPAVEAAPAAPAEPVIPATEVPAAVEPAAPQLYKLPDGREVDAAGLQREYENLLPEFTRKSQELAALKNPPSPLTNPQEPAWKDPNFQPKDWAEAIEIAKQEALAEVRNESQARQAAEQARTQAVEAQLAAIKTVDPKVDENALFEHAVKYGFNDLGKAHANMKALQEAVVATEQRVLKNVQTRAGDPIATTPTPAPATDGIAALGNPANYRDARDFLDALKTQN